MPEKDFVSLNDRIKRCTINKIGNSEIYFNKLQIVSVTVITIHYFIPAQWTNGCLGTSQGALDMKSGHLARPDRMTHYKASTLNTDERLHPKLINFLSMYMQRN